MKEFKLSAIIISLIVILALSLIGYYEYYKEDGLKDTNRQMEIIGDVIFSIK